MLPTPDGGWRPIGLLPTVIRIWMRARLGVLRAWQDQHERPYFYAGPGRGAAAAAWKQAAYAEAAATVDGAACANVLLVLVKAVERIPHWFLVRQAAKYGYSVTLLRLSVAAYRLARAVGAGGVYARLLWPGRGITAGSALATIEMRLVMIEAVDAVAALVWQSWLSLCQAGLLGPLGRPWKSFPRPLRKQGWLSPVGYVC